MSASGTRIFVVLLIGIAIVAGCGRRPASHSGPARQLKKSELSAAEQKYGIAPIPDSSVTYQPAVIVVGGGADAIRAQSPNGFVWTIDAKAPRAAELAPGKIFFMTNRAVGRVLDVHKDGGNLVVVVGPVGLTEVLREAHIAIDIPIDFGEAIAYTSPDLPGRVVSLARASTDDDAALRPAAFVTESGLRDAQLDAPSSDVSKLVNFKMYPFANTSGIGLEADSDANGLKLYARATLRLAKPTIKATINITPAGGLTDALLELGGAAGLTWKFAVGTDVGRSANVNGILEPDTDFSIPVGGVGPVPLAVTVRHRFLVKTGLGVRNTTLSATGDYKFTGAFMVGMVNKEWKVAAPSGFSANHSMMQTAAGISIGASGLDLSDQIKVIVGIGIQGFAVGPYFKLTSSVGLFKGSDLGMIPCKEATIVVKLGGGVGYQIPKSITGLINSFLRTLNIKYRIDDESGVSSGEPMTIINATDTLKGCKVGENR